ncbi:aspartate aminotransferase family protein [Luteolibacter sp. AS25]|uniref:aspartate aminotransferase family protein n=1 Tax=Luteolibacter sp. AS25 TaxID=3135776 RepID=UPI00398ACD08
MAKRLQQVECRNTTYISGDWPIIWERAEGANVWDVDGNRYLDMTSGFGVAGIGYGFTGDALREQSSVLMHAMGDVHPARVKVELCEALSEMTFERWGKGKGKCLFGNSGFEAVEAALKSAVMATGRGGILSFEGGYHGLGYGALLGAGIDWFRKPFEGQLAKVSERLKFPINGEELEIFSEELGKIDGSRIGAVLVEPIQGRGGIIVPPTGFLKILRDWCDESGAILIFDEIYTGFWRTGKLFACDWENVVPDLICLGKALSGGFPISVCVGSAEIMDKWPETDGEALHTSTFLGNPMGCAMALEALRRYSDVGCERMVAEATANLLAAAGSLLDLEFVTEIRGRGLMLGIQTDSGDRVIGAVKKMLKNGIIALPDGPVGDVLAFTPPFSVTVEEIDHALRVTLQAFTE